MMLGADLFPRASRRRHDEDDLQRAVVKYLRWALPHNATFNAIPLGGLRHKRAAQRLVGLGTRAGWPDLEIVWHGHPPIFIELKTPKGALSMVQRQEIQKLIHCGAVVMVCRSLAEVEQGLRDCGMRLSASVAA